MKKSFKCVSCNKRDLDKNTIGINIKMLGENLDNHYCIDCLESYLDTTTEELIEKIEEFKEDGCKLFE